MRPEGELDENELEAVAGGVEVWGACVVVGVGYGTTCFILGGSLCVIAGLGA